MMINSKRDFLKDIDRIRSLSSVIDKKLSEIKPSDSDKIDKLTLDELQDLDKIAGIADFMLTKYADKKEMCSILKNFTSVITDTASSMGNLDDEISELILSAEDSINKVSETDIWQGYDITAKLNSTSQFSVFYGSQKGGLVCANGVCAEQPGFDDGIKVTLRTIF